MVLAAEAECECVCAPAAGPALSHLLLLLGRLGSQTEPVCLLYRQSGPNPSPAAPGHKDLEQAARSILG